MPTEEEEDARYAEETRAAEEEETRTILGRVLTASGFKQPQATAALQAECEKLFERIAAAPTLAEHLALRSLMSCLLANALARGLVSPMVVRLLQKRLDEITTYVRGGSRPQPAGSRSGGGK